ncbi:MAG TPA: DUF402 domain-containing protein [Kribbella sp.]|nr:DUF402 domain-containing protein [Kribbella sp.]
MAEVRVLHRTGQSCRGWRVGDVVAYDVRILPRYQVVGRPTVDRSYLLLGEGVQLTRPVVFEGRMEGWWYVDLVEVQNTSDGLVVRDLYADLLIPPAGDRYQVLDLDELGAALEDGVITAQECARVLADTQRFVNRYLRGEEEGPNGPSSPFPPAEVAVLERLPSLLDPS